MKTENAKKYDKKYRSDRYQLAITLPADMKVMLETGAERNGKSKTQYIIDLIKKDNQ